jgi:hypothetical protein
MAKIHLLSCFVVFNTGDVSCDSALSTTLTEGGQDRHQKNPRGGRGEDLTYKNAVEYIGCFVTNNSTAPQDIASKLLK